MHPRNAEPTPKSLAAVLRGPAHARDLLIFRHPMTGDQLPKGTIEPGEPPADDDDIVMGLRLGIAPLPAPSLLAGQAVPEDTPG